MFLDANVLFSAARRPGSGLRRFWERPGVTLVSSEYAAEEARRNLPTGARVARLEALLKGVRLVPEAPAQEIPEATDLPEKDRPILQAALSAGATHLLTGDVRHFGPWLGRTLAGLRVRTPAAYLASRGSAEDPT